MSLEPATLCPQAYRLDFSFQSADELAAGVRDWGVEFRKLDRGESPSRVVQCGYSACHVGWVRLTSSFDQRGSTPLGMLTVALPAVQDIDLRWFGREVRRDELLVFPRAGDLASLSRPDFDMFTVSVPEERLDAALRTACGPTRRLGADPLRLALPAGVAQSLRDVCRAIVGPADRVAGARIQSVPELLVQALADGSHVQFTQTIRRHRAVDRARAYIDRHLREAPGIDEVCRAVGVSRRTLQLGFKESCGMGPKPYIKATRLNGFRNALLVSSPERRIADVANEWSFWHIGQLAADYRKLFGELPSETLGRGAPAGTG